MVSVAIIALIVDIFAKFSLALGFLLQKFALIEIEEKLNGGDQASSVVGNSTDETLDSNESVPPPQQ